MAGLFGCVLLASSLPLPAVAGGAALVVAGGAVRRLLNGRRAPSGAVLHTNEEIREYLLESASLGVVPFQAFGLAEETGWFRMSVGAVSAAEIAAVLPRLRSALAAVGA